ncbi:DNA/RNA non-specific endonuclease [Streptomyces sp. NPDC057580]|uniref:DNA/RNA non-specific endonuclease n=1 Tax=Streptomyces sp. NPDC057580 TaxID=3346173 RepID=UPI0036C6CF99
MTPSPDPTPDAEILTRESLTNRTGYNEQFLGPAIPLPRPTDPGIETVILPYTHFSVVFRPDRRLAASTAVMIDGQKLIDADRTNNWRFDPRLPDNQQTGDPVYKNNPLDKGHLVRRLDPVWGTESETAAANSDTFHYTNAAPQMDVFNQGKKLWQGLEDFLLNHAKTFHRQLSVFTGPVLEDSDPPYRGTKVPLRFWKVAAFMQNGELAATAYVLDQSPDLSRDAAARAMADAARAGDPPPLGAFRTFQVPVADVAEITGLNLGTLPAADRLPPHVRAAKRWTQLERFEDIVV